MFWCCELWCARTHAHAIELLVLCTDLYDVPFVAATMYDVPRTRYKVVLELLREC